MVTGYPFPLFRLPVIRYDGVMAKRRRRYGRAARMTFSVMLPAVTVLIVIAVTGSVAYGVMAAAVAGLTFFAAAAIGRR